MTKTAKTVSLGIIFLSAVLLAGHILYNWTVAYWLFEMSGGVRRSPTGWTEFGRVAYAWTTPLYIPGCLVFDLGQRLHSLRSAAQPYGVIGYLLLLSGSVVSAWSLASVLLAGVLQKKELLGVHYYRLVLAIAGWVWVYVPIEWTWVYQWTVVY